MTRSPHAIPRRERPVSEAQFRAELADTLRRAGIDRPFTLTFADHVSARHARDPRAYAEVHCESLTFAFAHEARELPDENRLALIAHEVGHAVDPLATENGADRAAERALGIRIVYDPRWPGKGLQRLAPVARNPGTPHYLQLEVTYDGARWVWALSDDEEFLTLSTDDTGYPWGTFSTPSEAVRAGLIPARKIRVHKYPHRHVSTQIRVGEGPEPSPYRRSANPREPNPLEVDDPQEFCERVAKAYDAAPYIDPDEVWRWHKLADHVRKMYRQMLSRVEVGFVDGQPYEDAEQMARDVGRTGVLLISREGNDHPVFDPETNLQFRAVHDYVVHLQQDSDFSELGELRAYNLHRRLAPPDTWPALFTEVAAQACYVNSRGEFPVQKVAVLPGFDFYRVGRQVAANPSAANPREPLELEVDVTHAGRGWHWNVFRTDTDQLLASSADLNEWRPEPSVYDAAHAAEADGMMVAKRLSKKLRRPGGVYIRLKTKHPPKSLGPYRTAANPRHQALKRKLMR